MERVSIVLRKNRKPLNDSEVVKLCSWIRKLIKSSHGVDWYGLVTMCYEARGQEIPNLHTKADAIPKEAKEPNCYNELAH